ncbi:CDP-glycerol glycerophosphotransferase family protein [Streptomyces sp. NPDC058092]|uniref:bifunctional glycosyltransferase/CDP-glycerol:glycerophosphate glycerophosphotransferase n=1 Tax=Streptomyces sp. NPDC058092 TaxID=3346336 RepID=UPI0036E99C22
MFLSVVVPVHRAQGYLRATLESVLGRGPGELELLVVDDGSRDGSAEIAAEFAARDPRVQVFTLPEHRGAGPARNAGAAEARGRYLLFLDGDDLLRPGALEAITDRLAGSEPDVLLLGHDRIDWWGTVAPAEAVPDGFSTVTPRLFRRAFWSAHGLRFTDGPYEDVLPVLSATLLAADAGTLDTLDRICVRHRVRRTGTFATTPGRHHFAILDAYERLLAATGHDLRIRAARTRHLRTVLADPGRIAPEDRAAFHRAADLPGSYAAHRAREAVRTGRTRTRAALRRRKKTLRARLTRAAYRADLLRPLDPNLAVYGAYWNRGVACNPAAIHAKALELAPHIQGVWVVSSRHRDRMPSGVPYVIEGSLAYGRVMATATYLINNSSFPGGFTKRPGQRYLQTHHGTPLKTMGLDQRAYPALTNGISFEKIVAHADQWDFSLSANPHTTEIWDRVYPSGYEHLNLGYPRNDVFFTATPERIAAIRQRLHLDPDRTVLLYAPTHRDYRKGFVPHLDLDRLTRELGPQYVVLVRAHYFYGRSAAPDSARVMDVTGHPSVEELCLVSDALITDYSSLMFDYACLDRPIISHAPDWAAYRASRGTYFDLLSGRPGDTPGAVATTDDELLELFRTGEWRSARTAELRAAFRERFCPYDDGHAAERVVRRLFLGGGE